MCSCRWRTWGASKTFAHWGCRKFVYSLTQILWGVRGHKELRVLLGPGLSWSSNKLICIFEWLHTQDSRFLLIFFSSPFFFFYVFCWAMTDDSDKARSLRLNGVNRFCGFCTWRQEITTNSIIFSVSCFSPNFVVTLQFKQVTKRFMKFVWKAYIS